MPSPSKFMFQADALQAVKSGDLQLLEDLLKETINDGTTNKNLIDI